MTWLEISGTVGRVAACLGFLLSGMVIFYLLTKVNLPDTGETAVRAAA